MRKSIKLAIIAAVFLLAGIASPYVIPILAQKVSRTTPMAGGPAGVGFLGDYDSGLTLLPTGATVLLTTQTVMVSNLFCHNSSVGAITVTVTDNQGSPVSYVPAVSIPAQTAGIASTVQFINGGKGIQMKGIRWSASGAGVNCQISGYN